MINIARVEGKPVPKKVTQWVKEANALKCQVDGTLKEEKNREKSSTKENNLCEEINKFLNQCPVEGRYDKPIDFVAASLHGTEENVESFLSHDTTEAEYGSIPAETSQAILTECDVTKDKIPELIQSEESEIMEEGTRLQRRAGKMPRDHELASPSEATSTEENNAHDQMEIGASYLNGDSGHDFHDSEIMEEGTRLQRRAGKMASYHALASSSEATSTEKNNAHDQMEIEASYLNGDSGLTPTDHDFHESEIIEQQVEYPIPDGKSHSRYLIGEEMFIHLDLSSSTPREMLNLSKSFGLDPERDKYFFSATNDLVAKPEAGRVLNLSGKSSLSLEQEHSRPNLVLLFLQRSNGLTRIPSSLFDCMPALRFLDLSNTRISVSGLPESLFRLADLQVLMLRSCVCLDSLPAGVENLKNMQVLDLSSTDLYSLPNEIGQLRRLKHLQMSFYGPDYGSGYAHLPQDLVSPSIFSELKDIEALSIVVHPEDQRWIKIAGEIIHYIKRLEKLSHLQFYFPCVEDLNSFVDVSPSWKKQGVRRFKFVVGHNVKRIISRVPTEVESKYDRFDQCLRFINGSHQVPEMMKIVLKSVKAFYLDHHLEIQNLSEFGISNFEQLELCVVRECPRLKVMMAGETSVAFPNLEHLGMHYLWELERIWQDPVPSGSFLALKCLMLETCPKLEYVASQSMLRSLSNLETFIIEDCEALKSIVKESKTTKSDATLLPRLRELVLRHLPKLATLGSGLRPSDEIITLHFCPELNLSPHPATTKHRKLLGRSSCSICI